MTQLWLSRPVDAASLAVFRIAFGAMMIWELARYVRLGRIERYYVTPALLFPYYGFGWLPRLPAAGFSILFGALILLAAAIMLGAFCRPATWLFFLGYSYTFLIDQTNYQNHLYLFCLLAFLLAITSPNAALAVDAARRRVSGRAVIPAWQPALVAFQIGVVYFYGGLNKLNPEWLSGVPMALNLREARALPGIGPWLATPSAAVLLAWGGMMLDLFCPFFLVWRRTRAVALVGVTGFHLANSQLFSIGIFPWFMLATTTIFLSPSWPRPLLRWSPAATPVEAPAGEALRGGRAALVVVFIGLQILLPLRHVLYGGFRAWDHEGYYFSWTMKLNTRIGQARLLARLGKEEKPMVIDLPSLLTPKQITNLMTVPDLMHRLARALRPHLPASAELHWDAFLSLNGRPFHRYIDPDVDLSQEEVSFARKPWILGPPNIPPPSLAEVTAPDFRPKGHD